MDRFLHELAIAAWPLLDGFILTVWISLVVIIVGSALGFVLGITLSYGPLLLRWLIRAYVDGVRGTPVLVLILASYYLLAIAGINFTAIQSGLFALSIFCSAHMAEIVRGAPVLVLILASYYLLAIAGINFTAIQSGLFALSIFCSAHMAEIVRGALQSIPRTQIEAGRSIGLTFPKILIYVLLPQASLQVLPVWINTGAELVKASTLLSVIGVGELLLRTQEIVGRNFMTLEFYALCGLLFFLINFALERLGKSAERRFVFMRKSP